MRVSRNGSDDEQEDERDDELDGERLPGANSRDGADVRARGVVDPVAHERGGGGAQHLRGDVRDEVGQREVAEDSHGNAHRRVQVAPGYVDEGEDEHHDRETDRHGDAYEALDAMVPLVHDDHGHLREHQDERPEKLCHRLIDQDVCSSSCLAE